MTVSASPTPVSLITHADALPAGTRLAEFELLGLLGVGGFGMVYQAFDHSLQRPVAIKEYMPATLARRGEASAVLVRNPADQPAFEAGLQSFVTEARLLAQFDHPSLVKVFRYWEDHRTAYMVMPLYRGITLQAARSQMRSPPGEAWLRKVLWAVLGALKTLHQGRAVHRDVSPDNIFLQDNGPPVLLDLGAARHAIGGKTQDLTDAFKLSYAPLEQHAGALGATGAAEMRQGPWTDLYALAAVVHGLLCNKPPLPATFRAVRDRLPPFARVARTVEEQFGLAYSPAFVGAMGQALAIDPKDRLQSVSALVQAMGLETPNGMSRFDWRAELGDIWVPPGLAVPQAVREPEPSAPARAAPRPGDDPTQPLAPSRRRDASLAKGLAPARGRSAWPWRAGTAALSVAALALVLMVGWRGKTPEAPVTVSAAPAAAVLPVVRVPAALGAPAPAAVPSPLPVSTAPDKPRAIASPPPDARPVPPARRPIRKPVPASQDPSGRPPAAEVVAAVPERAQVPVPAPVRAAPPDPAEPCAGSNFLTRSMCVFRECQKPELAGLPVCVENNARLQKNRTYEGF